MVFLLREVRSTIEAFFVNSVFPIYIASQLRFASCTIPRRLARVATGPKREPKEKDYSSGGLTPRPGSGRLDTNKGYLRRIWKGMQP